MLRVVFKFSKRIQGAAEINVTDNLNLAFRDFCHVI